MKKIKSEQINFLKDILGKKWNKIRLVDNLNKIKKNQCGMIVKGGNIIGLRLKSFSVKHLPESIGNLTSLQELWLFNNQLITLPESIGNLTSLQEI